MNRSAKSDRNREVQHFELDNAKRHRLKTVLLTMKKQQNQLYLEKINIFKDEEKNACLRDIDVIKEVENSGMSNETWITNGELLYCESFSTVATRSTMLPQKIPARSVPNILRNSSKVNTLIETKQVQSYVVDTEDCSETSFNSTITSENVSLEETAIRADENKYGKVQSHRRKQVYNPTDIKQDSPDWDSDLAAMKNKKSIEISAQIALKATRKKRVRQIKKKKQTTCKVSVSKETDQETCTSSRETLTDCTKAKDFICGTADLSFMEYGEEADLHNPIDFSSNYIFNNEIYSPQCADYLDDFITHAEEGCDSFVKECDINGNGIDICDAEKWPLSTNERCKRNAVDGSPLIANTSLNDSTQDLENEKLTCEQTDGTYCNCCCEDYASCYKKDSTFTQAVLSTSSSYEKNSEEEIDVEDNASAFGENGREICNANFIFVTPTNEMEHKSDFEDSDFACTSEIEILSEAVGGSDITLECNALIEQYAKEYSSNFSIKEKNNSNADLCNYTLVTLETSECTASNIGLTTLELNELDCEEDRQNSTVEGITHSIEEIKDAFIVENNFDILSCEGSEDEINSYKYPDTEVPESMEGKVKNPLDEEYQCLLCSLTFNTPRSMALHQAGAHGGVYAILCERCGRLFNKKYNFSRHLVHCGHQKFPFNCDMCIKVYRHKSSLVHHLKTTHHVQYMHNSSKTFTCEICSKMYSKFGAFQNHVNRHKCNW